MFNKKIISIILAQLLFFSGLSFSSWYSKPDKEKYTELVRNFIEEGDLVFDVGAHIGNKTESYLSCGANVICFEPQKKCLKILHEKFDTNENIIIIDKGLSSKDGYIDFFQCNRANTISTCSKEWITGSRFAQQGFRWGKPTKIEVTTLDKMIAKHGVPKFCKIDVENFEHEVLQGLSIKIPYLSFEFTYEYKENAKKCLEQLSEIGYDQFNFSLGETSCLFFNEWLPADILIERIYKENKCGKDLWGDIYAKG